MTEDEIETLEIQQIDAKRTIDEILAEPAYVAAVKSIEKRYLSEFMDAETDEARRQVWAKVRALQDLQAEFQKIGQDGKIAAIHREQREARDKARNAQRNPRK